MLSPMRPLAFVLAAASLAVAQTPDGFEPAVSQQLIVRFNETEVNPAGVTLPKDLTQTQPEIAVEANSGLSGTFVFFMIDIDVPVRDNVTQQITGRTPLLHCLQANFTISDNDNILTSSTSAADSPAPYRGPNPPAETPPKPHRYIQLLFQQPANFSVPEAQEPSIQARRGFNLTSFIEQTGLAEPLRGNYFLVVNTTGSSGTSTTASGGAGASATGTASPTQFTGKANVGSAVGGLLAVGAAAVALI